MRSRIILIGVIVILLAVVGIGLYFLFSSPGSTTVGTATSTGTLPTTGTQSNPTNSGTSAGSPGTASQIGTNFGPISDEPVLDYFVSPGDVVTAIEPDGEIISVADGNVSVLSSLQIQNIISAHFSYDGTMVFANFGNVQNPQTSIFNIATKAWTPMNAGWLSPAWSPADYRIAYYTANSNGTVTLATVNAAQAQAKSTALITLHFQDPSLAWLNKNQLTISTKPSAYVAGSTWIFDMQKQTLTPVALEAPGLELAWSGIIGTSAQEGLAFSNDTSGVGGALSLIDTSGNVLQKMSFLTLPSKCTFAAGASSTSYLYCGVPQNQTAFSFAHLPDDYDQMALFTSDNVYQINLQSGATNTVLASPPQDIDVSDIKTFNNTVFFVNRYDQKLYGVQLASGQ